MTGISPNVSCIKSLIIPHSLAAGSAIKPVVSHKIFDFPEYNHPRTKGKARLTKHPMTQQEGDSWPPARGSPKWQTFAYAIPG